MLRLMAFLVLGFAALSARAQSFTVTVNPTTYGATAGEITLSVSLSYPAQPTSLSFELTAPPGWQYGAIGGTNPPSVAPVKTDTGALGFAYVTAPSSGASFTFTMTYPAGLLNPQTFTGIRALYRSSTEVGSIPISGPTTLTITPSSPGGNPVAPTIITQPVSSSVLVGAAVTLNVAANGTAPFTYQWNKDGAPVAGATNSTLVLANIATTAAGSYTATVTNSVGSVTSNPAIVTVTAPTPPVIVAQPQSVRATVGGVAAFAVFATSATPLAYQWRKNDVAIVGATSSTLVVTTVSMASVGGYSVVLTNAGGSVTSSVASLEVVEAQQAPQIVTQPQAQSVAPGALFSFAVVATGSAPLAFQWRKDGAAIAGATSSTFARASAAAADAGVYSVVVSNGAGSVTSAIATLTVAAPSGAGVYFGEGAGGGVFALLVRADKSAVFLGRLGGQAFSAEALTLDAAGAFSFTISAGRLQGRLAPSGGVTGSVTIGGVETAFSAPAAGGSGTTSSLSGYYRGGAASSSSGAQVLVGTSGEALVLLTTATGSDAGRGTVDAAGRLTIATAASGTLAGTLAQATPIATLTLTPPTGNMVTYGLANNETRIETEKLINISTRSQVGGGETLTVGFVIASDAPKPVLIRAVGPTLAGFGVTTALPAARLEVFRQNGPMVASSNDWGAAANATAIATTAARVGAFPLPEMSRDAAVLATLEPGAYSAVVKGQGAASGTTLVEIYDATDGTILRTRRISNISTLALAGSGDNALIAGFVIGGVVPKRVLVRGIGPALTAFGVPGALAAPQLTVFGPNSRIEAQNSGWANSVVIAEESARVGAFPLVEGSRDAALIVYLEPGPYSARVSGLEGVSGTALIEVYELP